MLSTAGCDKPVAERVPDARAPTITAAAEGRTVHNPGAAERFVPRVGVPERPTFLFSGVLATARDAQGRQAVLPPAGDRLLLFDARGRFVRSVGDGAFVRAIAVTRAQRDWLVVERDGAVLSVPLEAEVGAPARRAIEPSATDPRAGLGQSPLSYATARGQPSMFIPIATITHFGDGFVAARSSFATSGTPDQPGAALLLELAPNGTIRAGIDTITSLGDPVLTAIANSGHLTASDSLFFFAPLVRDELRAYDGRGRMRWIATRALTWARPPRREPGAQGPGGLSYRPVNLAITTLGGLVYSLAYADSAGTQMRIDAFDELTGVLKRTASLPAGTMLISVDERGALWHAPADTLSVIGAPAGTVVVDFALPTPRGDTLRLSEFRGKVVLLNIWASWCGPCRDEFPLMAELSRDLPADDFAVVAVSDDMRESDARRFLDEFDPPFPVAWARGALAKTLVYNGLPFTVLLDRDGRVVKRYIGFGGRDQFERLRADIARTMMASPSAGPSAIRPPPI